MKQKCDEYFLLSSLPYNIPIKIKPPILLTIQQGSSPTNLTTSRGYGQAKEQGPAYTQLAVYSNSNLNSKKKQCVIKFSLTSFHFYHLCIWLALTINSSLGTNSLLNKTKSTMYNPNLTNTSAPTSLQISEFQPPLEKLKNVSEAN